MYAPPILGYQLLARIVGDKVSHFDKNSGVMFVECDDEYNYEDVTVWIDDYQF
jgi:hypothetical protein